MERASQPPIVFLDTHIICWLYQGLVELLSPAAAEAIDNGKLLISPIADLELQYLYEIGRISKDASTVLHALREDLDVEVSSGSFPRIIVQARKLAWTRDPFDRIMVAEAMASGASLVTKDVTVRQNFKQAIW